MNRTEFAKPAPGTRVGDYELVRVVSETPGAQVFEARTNAGESVAVKILSEAGADDHRADRFRHEIDVLLRTRHLNVIALLDHGTTPDGRPYLVTPFIRGRTLRELFVDGPACPEVALLLLAEVASGVEALHHAGLVHRDLKPENLMITSEGRVMIIDLGLATAPEHTRYTEEGAVVGSVPYMSPEQIEGADVTAPSDVWSLGVMAYEWIVGERPFQRARQSEEVAAILAARHAPLLDRDRRASPALAGLIADCLQPDPNQRPRDAAELAARVLPMIDWLHDGPTEPELRAIAHQPRDYEARVRSRRVTDAIAAARADLDSGDAFAATKHLDRGLAYAPSDPTLRALVEQALSQPLSGPPATIKPRRAWRGPVFTALGVLTAGALGIAIPVALRDDEPPVAPTTETAPADEAAVQPEPNRPRSPTDRLTTPAVRLIEPPVPADESRSDIDPSAPWQHAGMIILTPK